MKFDFSNYKGKYAMHCKTKEEAKDFCQVMHEDGRTWYGKNSYLEHTYWDHWDKETAYGFNEGTYDTVMFFRNRDYTILNWEDFMEKLFKKADLKDGMVGITRSKGKFVYLCGKFRSEDGRHFWGEIPHLQDDFSCVAGKELDFMQICTSSAEVLGEWFDDEALTPVWQRPEEITEMTISEIKTALGIAGKLKIKEDKQ